MPSLFKKRLSCFYCGRRSAQSQPEPIRKWQCQQCLAVNHLDEHGEITDPPASEASSGTRYTQYAQPIPRASSPDLPALDSSLFCSTCLKNQHLLTQTLASYLPSPSHPDYSAYEVSYPSYRKSLEERYPQVCESCEPQVRNRIRQVGYAAKSDHLRRMMEKSRHNRRVQGWSWRSMLVAAGAVCFWVSVAGQLAWNLMGAMAAGKTSQNLESDVSLSLVPFCFNRIWKRQPLFEECSSALTPFAGVALFLGMLSVWWNPKLRHKVEGKSGRLTGMGEYYKAQLIVLVVRFVAWACLQDPSITGLNPKLPPAIHGFMSILTIISVVVLRRVIKIDTTPLVSWKDDIEPLVSQKPKEDHSTQLQLVSPPDSQTSSLGSEPGLQRFPVNKLAPAASTAPDPYVPPSPQTDIVDDTDAMDWTPSQQSLQLNITPKPILVRQSQLPSATRMPSLGSRNPSAVQSILKALGQKPNPFRNAPVLKPKLSASQESRATSPLETIMAPPKFFPPSDFANDTGLESLFDKTFSIRDEPVGLQRQQWALRSGESSARSSRILKCVLLFISVFLLLVAKVLGLPSNSVETAVLGISFLVAGFSLLESLMRPLAAWSAIDIILSVIELFACVYLAAYRHGGSYDQYKFDAAGKSLVAFMVGQEMMALSSFSPRQSEPSQQNSTEQPPQDKNSQQSSSQSTQHQTQAYVGPHKKAPGFPPSSQQKPITSAPYPDINLNVGLRGGGIAPSTSLTVINNNNSRLMSNFNYPAHHHYTDQTHNPSYNYPPSISNDPTATHPAPFSSIPRPQPLVSSSFPSFPSFNSTLPDSLRFSPPSTTTTTTSVSYASETASEPPSPQQKYASLPSLSPGRRIPSPGISGLTLEDDPWQEQQQQMQTQARVQAQVRAQPRATRYALRSRRV
ncbi:hypothetical protein BDBG_02573 [Blastomyces gilchristii SLH14081]|uniref:Ima1 N-terminal domain-containing protein n=2 Tax=Blastomyces TaxID=229219 RepID=A0A179UE94_BLAGS|nr:uncharacterized protein BDBG_02573 [Blastomyces gilchristii SLH14081]EGE85558.1 hypothetical protein BDDG_08503 [Blastomyces dermatitidis ATCC 18188]EQL28555.1 hypothetical protein BDFG_08708 [Blastomyces dermatitidis ATCC 26199]OAT06345.1 hypothetical protein BDBG_02573 [Blastomyces gilchristii SLH14081]